MTVSPVVVLVAACLVVVLFVQLVCAARRENFWFNRSADNAQVCWRYKASLDKLSGLVATHRIDLDDEKLWDGYTEWQKTVAD